MKNKKLIILGAYGQQNIGDEAMLSSILKKIDKRYFEIYVNSSDPKYTSDQYGVDSFYTPLRKDFLKKIITFLKGDIIIYGGGTILTELRMVKISKLTPLYRTFFINLLSKLLNKKVIFLGIGVEEVNSWIGRFLLRTSVNLSDVCYVRDRMSYKVLEKYNCTKNLKLGADLVFLNKIKKVSKLKRHRKIIILPVYRIPSFDKSRKQYVETLSDYALNYSRKGYLIEFFPMSCFSKDDINDKEILRLIKREILNKNGNKKTINFYEGPPKNFKEFRRYLDGFDLVLSSRYHGLVMALLNNKPIINLSEFKKNNGLIEDINMKDFSMNNKNLNLKRLHMATDNIFKNYKKILDRVGKAGAYLNSLSNKMYKDVLFNYIKWK